MAYTAPGTAVAGDVLTAAFWNTNVRDNMEAVAGSPLARNILYNGAMQVAQRNTSVASITGTNYYTADRWGLGIGTLGTHTMSIESDAPTGSGLRKSAKVLCTTAQASPAAGATMYMFQALEGYDVQRIAKGTSSAQQLTLSFWVKSNKTGTYVATLVDNDNSRICSQSYTVSASATWEKKTLAFPADTTGAFDNDNAASLYLYLWLAAGSNFTSGTLQTTWGASVDANYAVGQTNLAANTNNYWQITGVQLETGSVATGFDFLPYGEELSRCQRYCVRFDADNGGSFSLGHAYSTTGINAVLGLPTQMRVAPTSMTTTTPVSNYGVESATGTGLVCNAVGFVAASGTNITAYVNPTVASGLTAGQSTRFYSRIASNYLIFSAEL